MYLKVKINLLSFKIRHNKHNKNNVFSLCNSSANRASSKEKPLTAIFVRGFSLICDVSAVEVAAEPVFSVPV